MKNPYGVAGKNGLFLVGLKPGNLQVLSPDLFNLSDGYSEANSRSVEALKECLTKNEKRLLLPGFDYLRELELAIEIMAGDSIETRVFLRSLRLFLAEQELGIILCSFDLKHLRGHDIFSSLPEDGEEIMRFIEEFVCFAPCRRCGVNHPPLAVAQVLGQLEASQQFFAAKFGAVKP